MKDDDFRGLGLLLSQATVLLAASEAELAILEEQIRQREKEWAHLGDELLHWGNKRILRELFVEEVL